LQPFDLGDGRPQFAAGDAVVVPDQGTLIGGCVFIKLIKNLQVIEQGLQVFVFHQVLLLCTL